MTQKKQTKQHDLGIYSWFGYQLHMVERAYLIQKAGFTVTSLWWGQESKEHTGSLHDLPNIVRDAGLLIDNIHIPFDRANDLWCETSSVREEIVSCYFKAVDDCTKHQIPKMVMHISKGSFLPEPHSDALNDFSRLIDYAERNKVIIAVENTRKIRHLDYIFSHISSPYLGLCYDCGHDFIWSDTFTAVFAKWKQRIVTTHISNNDGVDDLHRPMSEGLINWAEFTEIFPSVYTFPLILEICPKTCSEPPEVFLERSYNELHTFACLLRDNK